MKKLVFLFVSSLLFSGCATKNWEYNPRQYKTKYPTNYSINVLKFSDERDTSVNDPFKPGKFALQWVPFVLWSNVTDVSSPEGSLINMSSMTEVLPQATGMELSSTGLFKNVSVMPKSNVSADYTLRGSIINTHSSKTVTAYGLSALGNIISLFGVPSGNIRNSLSVKFTLNDKKGRTLFEKTYTENSWRPIFIYTELDKGVFSVQSKVYQIINERLVKDLRNIIAN